MRLIIPAIVLSCLACSSAWALEEIRTVPLCDGLKTRVTAVSSSLSQRDLAGAINFAITGARESCALISDKSSRSQIKSINEQAGQKSVSVGLDMQYLMPRVLRLARMTNGAFDPTVWSKSKKSRYQDIQFNSGARTVMLASKGAAISLRGILKGYLADRIAARLRSRGIHSYLINVGGTVMKSSGRGQSSSWMVGIPDPHRRGAESVCRVALVNRSMATVATYPWQQGRETYPGSPYYASVSILTGDANVAEALANAAMVAGPQIKGLIQRIQGAGAVVIDHRGKLSIVGNVQAACLQ